MESDGSTRLMERLVESHVRLAVVSDGCHLHQQRSAIAATARAFRQGTQARGTPTEVVLVVPMGHESDRVFEEADLPVRGFAWELLDGEASDRATYYAGLTSMRSLAGQRGSRSLATHAVVDDGIRHLCDCDAWILAQATAPAAVLPLRPFLVIADASLHHASGQLPAESLRIAAENLAASAGVLVFSEVMRQEVVDFYGVPDSQVRLLPPLSAWQAWEDQLECQMEEQLETAVRVASGVPEQGHVWFVADASSTASPMFREGMEGLVQAAWSGEDEQVSLAYGEAIAELL